MKVIIRMELEVGDNDVNEEKIKGDLQSFIEKQLANIPEAGVTSIKIKSDG